MRGRGRRRGGRHGHLHLHLHGRLGLVPLSYYGLGVPLANQNLVILLDEGATRAPVRNTAVASTAAFDLVSLADFISLHQGIDPPTAGETADESVYHAIAVHHVGRLHRRVSNPLGGLT